MTLLWRNKADIFLLFVLILSTAIFLFFDNITTLVWTILVPLLPMYIVIIGFSRWRNVCPLAEVSKISQRVTWIEKRKVPEWVEKNFYLIQYGSLFIALTLRLTVLNFSHFYLLLYFVFIFFSAFIVNLVYTGKSWCNFFCPVGVVERIYCLSNANNYMRNSACSTCTACKHHCPDIDMESNYWKENMNRQKSFAFYSFSGLILGFYLYFYLQSGSFSYYFNGDWTDKHLSLLSDGFFFAPFIPVVIAAPLTLALFALLSFALFLSLEKVIWRYKLFKNCDYATLQHKVKVISSFVAFNTFYIFAGAPSYSQYPFFYSILYFFIVAVSSMVLYKEFYRKEMDLIQERFALKIIHKWDRAKEIPSDLKEIYFRYINEVKNKKEILQTYRESIEELLEDGILDENSFVTLEKLREQIGVSKKDHFNVMRTIKLKNEELFDDSYEKSTEKKHQIDSYKGMILKALDSHTELEVGYIRSLQTQFQITDEEHKNIMHTIFNTEERIHHDILQHLDRLYQLTKIKNSLFNDGSREIAFVLFMLQSQFRLYTRNLFSLLFVIYKDNKEVLRNLLNMAKGNQVADNFKINADVLSFMDEEVAQKVLRLKEDFLLQNNKATKFTNRSIISKLIESRSIDLATSALIATYYKYPRIIKKINIDKFILHPNSDINAVAFKIQKNKEDLSLYEKMMYISYVAIFDNIRLYDLKLLAQAAQIQSFKKNSYIIKQGGVGDTLFILIKGKVTAEVNGKTVDSLKNKDYFGETALIGDTKRIASIRALSDVVLLTISKKNFQHFLNENPKIYTKLMKNIIKMLLNK